MSAYKPQNDYSIFVFTLKKKKVFVYHGFYLLRLVTGLVINPVSHSILKVANKPLLMNCRFEETQNFLFLKENTSNN